MKLIHNLIVAIRLATSTTSTTWNEIVTKRYLTVLSYHVAQKVQKGSKRLCSSRYQNGRLVPDSSQHVCIFPSVTMWYFDVQKKDQFFSSKSSTVRNRPQNVGFSRAKIKLKYQRGAKPTLNSYSQLSQSSNNMKKVLMFKNIFSPKIKYLTLLKPYADIHFTSSSIQNFFTLPASNFVSVCMRYFWSLASCGLDCLTTCPFLVP